MLCIFSLSVADCLTAMHGMKNIKFDRNSLPIDWRMHTLVLLVMHTFVLLVMIASSVGGINGSVAAILTEVARHVRAGCVYLLHEQDSGKWFKNAPPLVTDSRQITCITSSNFHLMLCDYTYIKKKLLNFASKIIDVGMIWNFFHCFNHGLLRHDAGFMVICCLHFGIVREEYYLEDVVCEIFQNIGNYK
jgi:hypothetical protein